MALMLVLARPPGAWGWQGIDVAVILASALSGPFCLLLLPVTALRWWRSRARWQLVLMGVVAAGVVVQLGTLLTSPGARAGAPLGAGPRALATILAGQVFLGGLLGLRVYRHIGQLALWQQGPAVFAAASGGAALTGAALLRARNELRLLALFSGLLLATALAQPLINDVQPQWPLMAAGSGNRYFFFPILAWLLCLVSLLATSRGWPRWFAGAAVAALLVGVPLDWRYPPYADMGFAGYAARFEAAPPGTRVSIPINPNWQMVLVRH
jgi:hypothetical protein